MIRYLVGAAIALGTGFLVWRGSGSLLKALVAAILIPVAAFLALGITLGAEILDGMSGAALSSLVIITIGLLAWLNRPV